MPFADWLPKIAPPWFRGIKGEAFFRSVGLRMDDVAGLDKAAVKARFPGQAPGDGLDYIGVDRLLPRGPAESDAAYKVRLAASWTIWGGDNTPLTGVGGGAGSHLGLLTALKTAGVPTGATGATIVQQNGRYSQLDGGGALVLGSLMQCINRLDLTGVVNSQPGWTFEQRDTFYSEFGIVFPVDVAAIRPGSAMAALINATVQKWRPAKTIFVGTWVIASGISLGWPAGARTCGTEPNLGSNIIYFIPPPNGGDTAIGYHSP